jgi:hypothetical protein
VSAKKNSSLFSKNSQKDLPVRHTHMKKSRHKINSSAATGSEGQGQNRAGILKLPLAPTLKVFAQNKFPG